MKFKDIKVGDTVYRECVIHGRPDYVQYGVVIDLQPSLVWVDIQGPNGPAGEAPWGMTEIHATREEAIKVARKRDAAFDALGLPEPEELPKLRSKPYVGISKTNPHLLHLNVDVKDKEVFLDIDLEAVRNHLVKNGWVNKFPTRYCDIYEKQYPGDELPHQLHVPFTRELADFVNVVYDIVNSLAKLNGTSQMQLLYEFSPLFRQAVENLHKPQ